MSKFQMSKKQAAHIRRVIDAASTRMYEKYKFGCEEHASEYNGELLDVPLLGIVNHAIDEAVDQLVYLLTIKEKIEKGDYPLPEASEIRRSAVVRP